MARNRLVARHGDHRAYEAAAERIFQVVADDAWDQWCERPSTSSASPSPNGPVPTADEEIYSR